MREWRMWTILLTAAMALLAEDNWSQHLSRAQDLQGAADLAGAQREFRVALVDLAGG